MFNQVMDLPEALVSGREETYLNYIFDKWSWHRDKVAAATYIEAYKVSGRLTAGFYYYRSIPETIRQNKIRATKNLEIPVLAIGAEQATNDAPYKTMKKSCTAFNQCNCQRLWSFYYGGTTRSVLFPDFRISTTGAIRCL